MTISKEKIAEVHALFARAEALIKSLEHTHGLFIPTVNQLRYSGRHLIDFIADKDDEKALCKAERHCQRAIYDACDAHIQMHINEAMMFQSEFEDVVITDVFQKFPDLILAMHDVLRFLEKIDHETREEKYEEALHHKERLEELTKNLPLVRNELIKRLSQSRNAKIAQWVGYGIGLIGIALTILSVIIVL